jgi:hypothetical protein
MLIVKGETFVGNRLETLGLSRVLVFLIGLLLLPIPPAGAQSAKFEATLSGKEQAPPIDTPAKAAFVLSGNGKSLHYTLSVVDIENATMAHIHIGHAGEEGPIAVWLYPSNPSPVVRKGKFTGVLAQGTITAANLMGPLQGKTLEDLVSVIKVGDAYVNVHTTAHPGGEIRGQLK